MLALGAATAGVGSAMDTVYEAMSRESLTDVLAAQLGASPELAAQYGKIAGDLYKQGLGESFADVSSAVGAVQSAFQALGAEGEASIDQVTATALNFQKVFGSDVPESVQTASQLVTNGLAKDSTEAFDLMTTAFQRVPAAMRDELPEIINEYGTHFRGLGFNGQEAFTLLVDAAQNGKWALDKTGDALKEFTLRGSDMSKASQEAYESIGLDAAVMSDAVASGGDEAQDALQRVAQGLLGIESPAERANTAVALFGTPVEDLAIDQIPQFLEALAGGSESMSGFAGAAGEMGDTVNNNTSGALERLKRGIQDGLVTGLTESAGWVEQNKTLALIFAGVLGTVVGAITAVKVATVAWNAAQTIAAGATKAWTAVQWLWNAAMSANPLGLIVIAIAALVAGIVVAYNKSETFRNIVQGAFSAIGAAASWLWDTILKPYVDWFVGNLQTAGNVASWLYTNAVKPAFDGIGAAASWLWDNALKPAMTGIVTGLGWVNDKATEVREWIVGKFTEVIDHFQNLPGSMRSAVSGLFDPIRDSFKTALNWLIEKWNNFRLSFDFNIPVVNKHVQFAIDTPDLPLFNRGGVVSGPGTGTSDSILAMVSDGEFIVRAQYAKRYRSLLESINAGTLPGYAGGGLVDIQNWARGEAGKPYQYGGTGNPSWDCSAFVGGAWAIATGKEPNRRYFNTESDFPSFGFVEGLGGPNDLSIGVMRGGGGPNSHMAMTIGDLNAESSGSDGVEVGSRAQGAADFPLQWHFPLGGNPLDGALDGSTGGGLGSGGTGGSSSSSTGDGTSGSSTRPAGNATPVWVDNWPSNLGSSSSSTTGASSTGGDSSSTAYTPDDGGTSDQFDQAAAIEAAWSKFTGSMGDAGNTFLSGQKSAVPGVGGYIDGTEKQVSNVQIVVADVYEAMNAYSREQKRQTVGK
ncbi:hypothetical protein F5X71_00415 [Nocardia brasiliensis]|uniref:Phage tail tape measure protein domain-containing protein n=1 Tax=Nocardia brasiliensis TaxID=37326 RepID=A0A6G9XJA2_NOCBR|nr:phage tail tape measure protein [Nocardia brasiliensis]QIS00995.1 hypothetical protein F5X71_00415 [Nocardia brasiliensis]